MVQWLLAASGAGICSALFGVILKYGLVPPLVRWQIKEVRTYRFRVPTYIRCYILFKFLERYPNGKQ